MHTEFHISNRKILMKALPSGTAALISSGHNVPSSLDTNYPFETDRNFYYFTGIARCGLKLVLYKTDDASREILVIPRIDPAKERWTGKFLTPQECTQISGVSHVIFEDELDDLLYNLVFGGSVDTFCLYMDPVRAAEPQTKNNILVHTISRRYPNVKIENLSALTAIMRMCKTPEEVLAIRQSNFITKLAVEEMLKNIKPGIREYEAQACFEYVVKRHGAKIAFNTIAAGGDNATMLHYESNRDELKDGDMILVDCGASVDWYNADVTRTFPVNGKFTDRQLEIYKIVLGANQFLIEKVRPGMSLIDLNEAVKIYFAEELKRIGLISDEHEVGQYYYHMVSHHLGLDVHDVGSRKRPLEAGMVITIEPGLYIAQYGIGIRIEDNVLITQNGCEVLTDILKDPYEIEEFMDVWEVK